MPQLHLNLNSYCDINETRQERNYTTICVRELMQSIKVETQLAVLKDLTTLNEQRIYSFIDSAITKRKRILFYLVE